MKKPRPEGHLDVRSVLDYLEGRAEAAARRRVEDHLERRCPDCHALVRELQVLVERMRLDRAPEVPAEVRQRALSAFRPLPSPRASRPAPIRARILFDSPRRPLIVRAGRATSGVRRVTLTIGTHRLDLEIVPDNGGRFLLRGLLRTPEPMLHRVQAAVGRERYLTSPDVNGVFGLERLPGGKLRVTITGPTGRSLFTL